MTTDKSQLCRGVPEAQGISSSAISAFVDTAEKNIDALHSFMLLRHGQVVAEGWWYPYAPEYPHMLFSLSKSFTSTAIGFAVAEGRLTVDDAVLSFFPEDTPAQVSQNLADMRVRHLLSMSTGHAEDTTGFMHEAPDGNWVKAFLARPVEYVPGTHFLYNTGATYMLSAIVQKLSGVKLLDYLQPRLFQLLGIENPTWETCPRGINTGGYGLSVKTEDIARFGQLYLQKGMWRGVQLIPETWVEEATSRQVANTNENIEWRQGYGYQFWRCRYGAYRGDGAFGQFCIVMPAQDAVLAITSGVGNMQAVLDLAWEYLLPAMGPVALPEDSDACAALSRKLSGMALPVQKGQHSSALAEKVSGKIFNLDANEQKVETASLDLSDQGCTFTIRDQRGEHRVACGSGTWLKGVTTLNGDEPQPVAASSAWTAEDTYTMKLYFYETPFCLTITSRFTADQVTLNFKTNVGFGPTEHPPLVGRRN
ncbi:MAG: beta-lactamase family protein [Chloroflexi bacterium]|nr:beta-lactamase family protein [Chloroflexota bacterium]